jgi:pimeloyl-ACP methyl ester carboxylesterase
MDGMEERLISFVVQIEAERVGRSESVQDETPARDLDGMAMRRGTIRMKCNPSGLTRPGPGRIANLLIGWLFILPTGCRTAAPSATTPDDCEGRVILLPGISNISQELGPFAKMLRESHPGWSIELRRWGPPLRPFRNLFSEPENRRRAEAMADEIAAFKRAYPDRPVYLLGYSGGGAVAAFIAESLPDDVKIERLVLMAPALSQSYPFCEKVMPKVDEFGVVYASRLDVPVSMGTRLFGTIDRKAETSAGARGFNESCPNLAQIDWNRHAMRRGHFGAHSSYMSRSWQRACLLPAFAAGATVETLRAACDSADGGSTSPIED